MMLLFLLSLPVHLLAQKADLKFEHIGIEQGLSNSRLFAILQDHQGFMWFATNNGLNKYDGYNFTVYKSDPDNPNSLSHNVVRSLYEDHAGVLWIGTFGGGLNKFDWETETFTRYQHDPNNPNSLGDDVVRTIYEDRAGVLWIGLGGHGLDKFDRERGIFTHYQFDPDNPNSLSANDIYTIHEDPEESGVLWIGTGRGGLNKFDLEKETFTRYQHDPENPKSLSHDRVWLIYEDRAGVFWIGTDGGLNKFDRETETFTRYQHDPENPNSLSHNVAGGILEDRDGVLWIATGGGGLNKFDREKEIFIHYQHNPGNPNSLSHNRIGPLYEDRSGILWIGSWGEGINKLDRDREQFTHYHNDANYSKSWGNNWVSSLYEDRAGVLWIGTTWDAELTQFDREKEVFTRYRHTHDHPNNQLSEIHVKTIYEDRTGVLWVGMGGGGLNRFDRKTRTFTRYQYDPDNPNSLNSHWVSSLYEDPDAPGVLWIGTEDGGLNRFDQETEAFTRYQYDPENPNSLGSNWVSSLYEDPDELGVLWIGTEDGGLNKFDRKTEDFIRYRHDPHNRNSLSHNKVFSICKDPHEPGVLWIGTDGGGLNKFDRAKETFTHYREKDGLPDNSICGILADNRGNLWLSTRNGLCRFNPQTMEIRKYGVEDGLQSTHFSDGAYHKSRRTGEMFFGGIKGFTVFHPDSIRDNPYIPPVAITAFQRYNIDEPEGDPIFEKGISAKQELILSYKDKVLVFEFAALSYRNTFKNQYAYQLEGLSDNWIHLGARREVTFTGLDPGEYTLRVKGSNNDGVWNEEGVSLKITLIPPWWRTLWAYGLYVLLFLSALYGIRHYELGRFQLRNELKIKNLEAEKMQEVDRLKSRFFASISHEFRTPLTLILGPVEKWLARIRQTDMKADFHLVRRNARRLQQLIDQLLDLSKLEAGKMILQARPENIVGLIRMYTMAFESLAKQQGLDLLFRAPKEEMIAYVERDKLEKIVTNLLSNAFKFTTAGGIVSVQLSVDSFQSKDKQLLTDNCLLNTDHCLLITVRDTGIGIPADQLDNVFNHFHQADNGSSQGGTGIGLALTKELVELHHGWIAVESEIGRGTTFIVGLPLGKEHLTAEEIVETVSGDQYSVISGQYSVIGDQFSEVSDQSERSGDPDHSGQQATGNELPTLLIVEDNTDMRGYIRGCLEEHYRIIEAEDGAQGMKQAHKHAPDLILSDVMMPEMDGFSLCEKLKTDARTSHIPVVLITARASGESKVEGLETGADDYLTKPFDAKELRVRIKNLIEQRRRLRERFRRELVIEPSEITVTSMDEDFLKNVMAVVEANIDDPAFETDDLAREAGTGRRQLNRKLRALTGQSVREFIRTIRLKRAAQLLQQQAGTVTEIAYEVGFNSIAHFAKIFREQFGVAPSEYGGNG